MTRRNEGQQNRSTLLALGLGLALLHSAPARANNDGHCAALARDYQGQAEHTALLNDCFEAHYQAAEPAARAVSSDSGATAHAVSGTLFMSRALERTLISGPNAEIGTVHAVAIDSGRNEVIIASSHELKDGVMQYRLQAYDSRINGAALIGRSVSGAIARNVTGLAVDEERDRLWISSANENALVAIGRRANERAPHLAFASTAEQVRIQGDLTGLNAPKGVSVYSATGELFVANSGSHEILVFAADATGNVAPVRRISGSNSLLNNPQAVRIENGSLVVENREGSVVKFALTASGNAQPLTD